MKNFDSEWEHRKSLEARTLQVCGEQFVMRSSIRPEAFEEGAEAAEDTPLDEAMAIVDGRFLSMVEPEDGEAEKRYRELRARDNGDGLSIRDIREVIDWMIEQQTGRPPTLPTASTAGRARTGTRSTAGSSSRASQAA